MKKLILAFALTSALFSCQKETTTPNNTGSNTIQNPKSGFGPNITDSEGTSYKTVYIGTQTWMAENLKVSKYNDGTTIPNITDNKKWRNDTTGAWCNNNNSDSLGKIYGKLYNWYAVSKISNGNKNVCPTGWHVPTDGEWTVLIDYLGGGGVAGGKMKEVSTTSWNSPNTDATNTSLFSALPGGMRSSVSSQVVGSKGFEGFEGIGIRGAWWSSTEQNTYAWCRELIPSLIPGNTYRYYFYKKDGLSVRCLKD
jgi:uncharacterized protein (TIGR02145 family)